MSIDKPSEQRINQVFMCGIEGTSLDFSPTTPEILGHIVTDIQREVSVNSRNFSVIVAANLAMSAAIGARAHFNDIDWRFEKRTLHEQPVQEIYLNILGMMALSETINEEELKPIHKIYKYFTNSIYLESGSRQGYPEFVGLIQDTYLGRKLLQKAPDIPLLRRPKNKRNKNYASTVDVSMYSLDDQEYVIDGSNTRTFLNPQKHPNLARSAEPANIIDVAFERVAQKLFTLMIRQFGNHDGAELTVANFPYYLFENEIFIKFVNAYMCKLMVKNIESQQEGFISTKEKKIIDTIKESAAHKRAEMHKEGLLNPHKT